MQPFPWWNETQKQLAIEAKQVVDEILMPIGERAVWKKEFPRAGLREMARRGWFGAQIPAKYGGHAEEWGVTGSAIILEEAARAGAVARSLATTMFGGIHQITHDGTEEQRQRWLPKIARGERLGSITITEPYVGSDAASIETAAVLDGDYYIVNGRKRFQTNTAAADLYMTYVKTSDSPEDRAKYSHLTALVIEKGSPGFSVEKINELMAYDGIYNGYLSFNDARVPVANRLGKEGDGWRVLTSGLNVERILNAAPPLGLMRESIRYALQHMQRRIQFGATTGDIAINQFKIADMFWRLEMGRLMTYYAAYLADLGQETPIEAAVAKMFNTDEGFKMAADAIQIMGGNGATRFYPVERMMRDLKMNQIAAGTSEILKLLTYRQGLKRYMDDLKPPIRVIDEELGVPMPVGTPPPKKAVSSEDDILAVLAENYRVNPGLHMTMDDLKELLDVSNADLEKYLLSLEKKGLAGTYRDRRGNLALARVTYKGLNEAHEPEYYRYMPSWANPADLF